MSSSSSVKDQLLCVRDFISDVNKGSIEIDLDRALRGEVANLRILGYAFSDTLNNHPFAAGFRLRLEGIPVGTVLQEAGKDSQDILIPFSGLQPFFFPYPLPITTSGQRIRGFKQLRLKLLSSEGVPFTFAANESVEVIFWFALSVIS